MESSHLVHTLKYLETNYKTDGAITSLGAGTGLVDTGIVPGVRDRNTCANIANMHSACGIQWLEPADSYSVGSCSIDTSRCVYRDGVIEVLHAEHYRGIAKNCRESGGRWQGSDVEGMCDCGSRCQDSRGRCTECHTHQATCTAADSGGTWANGSCTCPSDKDFNWIQGKCVARSTSR